MTTKIAKKVFEALGHLLDAFQFIGEVKLCDIFYMLETVINRQVLVQTCSMPPPS